jgi:hypothetical protein
VKLQSLEIGGYAMHLPHVLTPGQALVRVGEYVVAIGGTEGGMAWDTYEAARLYRIRSNGTLVLVRKLPTHARALANLGETIFAIAFDLDKEERDANGHRLFATTAHLEAFNLAPDGKTQIIWRQKPPLKFTTFMRWLTPLSGALALAELPRPEHSSSDRIEMLTDDGRTVLATHLVRKIADVQRNPLDPTMISNPEMKPAVLSLSTNGAVLAARLANGRIQLLDVTDSLRLRSELRIKGLAAVAILEKVVYAYSTRGMLYAFDISNPDNALQIWVRKVPRVPDPKGLVVDGNRIIVHGIGLTEAWANESKPAVYYQVAHKWKALECVILNGDLIYAFNGQASVSKLMVLRMNRP